jgi:hypothetical protein
LQKMKAVQEGGGKESGQKRGEVQLARNEEEKRSSTHNKPVIWP